LFITINTKIQREVENISQIRKFISKLVNSLKNNLTQFTIENDLSISFYGYYFFINNGGCKSAIVLKNLKLELF